MGPRIVLAGPHVPRPSNLTRGNPAGRPITPPPRKMKVSKSTRRWLAAPPIRGPLPRDASEDLRAAHPRENPKTGVVHDQTEPILSLPRGPPDEANGVP